MTRASLVLRYAVFAVLATAANLATQRLVLQGSDGAPQFALAVGAGTMTGLVVKYLLDKRWIFRDRDTGLKAHGRKFTLYAAMGLVTTAIFWGAETLFWLVWQTDPMREAGALLGLALGYALKYNLDRRYVFAAPEARFTA